MTGRLRCCASGLGLVPSSTSATCSPLPDTVQVSDARAATSALRLCLQHCGAVLSPHRYVYRSATANKRRYSEDSRQQGQGQRPWQRHALPTPAAAAAAAGGVCLAFHPGILHNLFLVRAHSSRVRLVGLVFAGGADTEPAVSAAAARLPHHRPQRRCRHGQAALQRQCGARR